MTDECLVIVMEYAAGGALNERIKTNGRLPEAEAKKFYAQLIDGLLYCHEQVLDPAWALLAVSAADCLRQHRCPCLLTGRACERWHRANAPTGPALPCRQQLRLGMR